MLVQPHTLLQTEKIGGLDMKPYVIVLTLMICIVLILPAAIVLPYSNDEQTALPNQSEKTKTVTTSSKKPALNVSVYRSDESKVESVPLQQYVIGVVASEMPAEFEPEALKAQALAARTLIVKELLNDSNIGVPKGAEVTDTVMHQVYHDDEELKELWGSEFDWKMAKIKEAVQTTEGQILTYDNKPIEPSFFSTSNGYTENSGAYWQQALPYLKSVPSPWDQNSPKFLSKETIPVTTFEKKLNVDLLGGGEIGKIVKTTPGNRVGTVEIAGKTFAGRDIRDILGLPSTDFTMEMKDDQVIVSTKGNGHGVGMSQYGANGMAKEGKSYEDIVTYFYQGVSISNIRPYTAKLTAAEH
jgi:stage II sporulation protein D